jgi:AcrR family transcriptional regulator
MEMADSAGSVEALSLTSLAQALDIRVPSLYNHIASLEDLQHAMTVAGLQGLVSALRQAAAGLVGQEALAAIAHAYRRFARTHPAIYPLTIRAPEPDDIELSTLAREVLQMLLLVMASFGLHGDNALHAIRGLRAILHGFASLEAAGGYKMPLDHDESFRRLVDTYLNGLAAPERVGAALDVK